MRNPLISIGLCQFGISLMQTLFMFYYVKVYINEFHINTVWFNVAQTLFMIWNTINDPLFGYLQDTPGFWLNDRLAVVRVLSPFLVFSFIFLWIPWNTEGSSLEGIHLILSLFSYDAFFSAIGVAWGALFADTTTNKPNIRVKALKYSQIAILLSVFSIALTEKISLSLKNFRAFQIICFTAGIASLACLLFASKSQKKSYGNEADSKHLISQAESMEKNENQKQSNPLTFRENMGRSLKLTKQILLQRKFIAIITTNFFQTARSVAHMNFASMITELVIPQEILPSGSVALSLFFAVLTLGPQVLLILNESLVAKIGASRVMIYSYLISFLSGFLIILSSSPYFIMFFMLIDCVTVHSISPLFNVIISDFVDEDARDNNRPVGIPSIIFSLNALFVKPAQSIAPVVIVYFLNNSGYQDYLKSKTATTELKDAVLWILFLTPLLLGGFQYLMMKLLISNSNSNNKNFKRSDLHDV